MDPLNIYEVYLKEAASNGFAKARETVATSLAYSSLSALPLWKPSLSSLAHLAIATKDFELYNLLIPASNAYSINLPKPPQEFQELKLQNKGPIDVASSHHIPYPLIFKHWSEFDRLQAIAYNLKSDFDGNRVSTWCKSAFTLDTELAYKAFQLCMRPDTFKSHYWSSILLLPNVEANFIFISSLEFTVRYGHAVTCDLIAKDYPTRYQTSNPFTYVTLPMLENWIKNGHEATWILQLLPTYKDVFTFDEYMYRLAKSYLSYSPSTRVTAEGMRTAAALKTFLPYMDNWKELTVKLIDNNVLNTLTLLEIWSTFQTKSAEFEELLTNHPNFNLFWWELEAETLNATQKNNKFTSLSTSLLHVYLSRFTDPAIAKPTVLAQLRSFDWSKAFLMLNPNTIKQLEGCSKVISYGLAKKLLKTSSIAQGLKVEHAPLINKLIPSASRRAAYLMYTCVDYPPAILSALIPNPRDLLPYVPASHLRYRPNILSYILPVLPLSKSKYIFADAKASYLLRSTGPGEMALPTLETVVTYFKNHPHLIDDGLRTLDQQLSNDQFPKSFA
jgi:hypothetical protein